MKRSRSGRKATVQWRRTGKVEGETEDAAEAGRG